MSNTLPFLQRACLCLAFASAAGAAQATVISYDFTATVSELTYYAHTTPNGPGPGVSLTSSDYAGANISIGNLVHGRFFYDTQLGHVINQPPPPPSDQFGQYGGAGYSASQANMRYSVDASGLSFNSGVNTPVITITDHPLVDWFHMVTITQNSAGLIQESGITLIDSRHTAFNSTALPGTMSQAQFTSMAIYNSFRYAGRDDNLNATMIINSLTPGASTPTTPPPVPEPETWGMLLLGLAGVGLLARHKRGAKLA